ncbi:hypothetical protein ACQP2T_13515 [Nonomuraea sp. CA-143628]|uniref:hypothetical protein n=1 Tax=Nonomuraea sp. CA-143628 TaxID=3239997 RepID=UPI003D93FC4B
MTTFEAAYRQAESLKGAGASRESLIERAEGFDAAWQFSAAAAFRAVADGYPTAVPGAVA